MTDIYDLQQTAENSWQAKYHGNYGDYTIKITLGENFKVKKYSCTCPSGYQPCKHISFVLAEIKKKASKFEAKNASNELSVADVLQNVSLDELRGFVIDKAKYNSDLTKSIMLQFAERIKPAEAKNTGNKYAQMIGEALAEADTDYDYEDYYYDEGYSVDLSILGEWAEKAQKLLTEGKFIDAEQICKAAIEEFANWYEDTEDSYVEISLIDCISDDYQEEFVEMLKELAKNGQTDKKQLYEWCKTEIAKKKYFQISSFNLLNDLMLELANDVSPADFIASQEKVFEQILDKSSYEAQKVLQRLIDFYNANNQKYEAEKIVEDNLQIDNFRKIAVEKRIESKQYSDAKKLLDDKLKNCDKWRQNEWKELLLTVAQKENDTDEIRRIALEFLEIKFDNEHFAIYKKAFSGEEWTTAFDNLYKHYNTPKNQRNKGFSSDVAELLKAENLTERLLEYCEKYPSLSELQKYHTAFSTLFPQRTLDLFQKVLDKFAESTGRDIYEKIAEVFKQMQKIAGGQQVVTIMAENYRAIYKNRPAMKEILKKGNF
ncbi:MAG: hypothetical protein LBD35_05345 [Prevotellaceae bacterium]|jgi:hypothetical protein|nr:hypothetical protein [Prevotellaceae bacterium]